MHELAPKPRPQRGSKAMDLITIGAFIVAWFLLSRYVLPKLGVPT